MTIQYEGSGNWTLYFGMRKRVKLSTHEIEQIIEQAPDALYGDKVQDDMKKGTYETQSILYEQGE